MIFTNRVSCADFPTSYPASVYHFSHWWSRLFLAGFRYLSLSTDACKSYVMFLSKRSFLMLSIDRCCFDPLIAGSKSSVDFHDHQNITFWVVLDISYSGIKFVL